MAASALSGGASSLAPKRDEREVLFDPADERFELSPRPRDVEATLRLERDAGREGCCAIGPTADVSASENPQPSSGESRPAWRRPCAVSGREAPRSSNGPIGLGSHPGTTGSAATLATASCAERGEDPRLPRLVPGGLLQPVAARADCAPERCPTVRGDGRLSPLPRADAGGGRAVSDVFGPLAPSRSSDLLSLQERMLRQLGRKLQHFVTARTDLPRLAVRTTAWTIPISLASSARTTLAV